MTTTNKGQYTASDIQVLEGLEAVRRRPGMYIGSTDERGLHHLAYEIVDNAIDEAMAGFCDRITITLHADNSMTVHDDGRGIPVDIHAATGRPALETIMTTLHAGGKFGGGAYKVSGGLHGVGSSVVNALSEQMRVEVRREGRLYYQEYQRGDPVADMVDAGPLDEADPIRVGTVVTFLADTEVFGRIRYDWDTLLTRFREMAYLNKAVWIICRSDAHPESDRTFYFEGGISSFVRHLNHNREVLQDEPFYMEQTQDTNVVEIALQYNGGFYETTLAFANCINTVDGGKHLEGFRAGLTRAINNYAKKSKLVDASTTNFSGEDVREGLTAIVSVRMEEPQFEGQTKGKLGNAEIKTAVEQLLVQHLEFYLEEHPAEGRRIIEKCFTSQRARDAAKKARDLVIRKNAMDGGSLPGKLADCAERDPALCELYVVEGESAGGSAKMGRDRRTQAILPLRGKILNVEKARPDRMFAHEEIRALIMALGAGLGEDINIAKLRYHKVIIMTDADVDGAHIRTLLLTFFFRNMVELIEGGYLYIAQPPLYRVSRGRTAEYKYAEADKDEWMAKQLFGRISVASGDGKVTMSGAEIQGLVDRLQEFLTWTAPLSSLGLTASLVGTLLLGVKRRKYRLAFEGPEALEAVREWFAAQGYECTAKTNEKQDLYTLEVPGHGTINVKRVLESAAAQRANQLYATISQWVNGQAFSIKRRDSEVATGVLWNDLAASLTRHSERQGIGLQRYKGLGEMNPDQLWETTMDPAKRTLLQVSIAEASGADEVFTMLMGDLVQPRKEFIQAHARSVKNLDV
ncbi:MAG: DNA topoisomerase (ATP-hydrolyzing) subunit B [Chloroflexi bacterium]|nr:DNA topoisomerase (ATP-hydrolyzing) subunit B [Chloroflexota bacterium]